MWRKKRPEERLMAYCDVNSFQAHVQGNAAYSESDWAPGAGAIPPMMWLLSMSESTDLREVLLETNQRLVISEDNFQNPHSIGTKGNGIDISLSLRVRQLEGHIIWLLRPVKWKKRIMVCEEIPPLTPTKTRQDRSFGQTPRSFASLRR